MLFAPEQPDSMNSYEKGVKVTIKKTVFFIVGIKFN